jgi:polygalacturonase
VAIKAGSSPATDMTIEHNHFYGTHGISIGSETNGGVANILVRDNTVDGVDGRTAPSRTSRTPDAPILEPRPTKA